MVKPPPKQIGGAKVICFAFIDSRVQPTGNCEQIVGSVLQGPAAGIAICQYGGDGCFYLFGCDPDWHSATDTWHESLEDAKHQAEFEYVGVSKVWQQSESNTAANSRLPNIGVSLEYIPALTYARLNWHCQTSVNKLPKNLLNSWVGAERQ